MDLPHMSLYFGEAHHIMHWPEFPSVFVGCLSYSIGFFLHRSGRQLSENFLLGCFYARLMAKEWGIPEISVPGKVGPYF
jgi:hypothetical protein